MAVSIRSTHLIPEIYQSGSSRTAGPHFDWLIAAESTRHGGVSRPPYESLNLGLFTDDDPKAVAINRRRFFRDIGAGDMRVAGAYQVHGSEVLEVAEPGQFKGYDALITDRPGLLLTVTVADCAPVLLADPQNRAVAAVHAGWRGTVANIAQKAFHAMKNAFGTDPSDCYAYIGACISECAFEVDADVADHFDSAYKRWDTEQQKFFIDLKAANCAQLIELGLCAGHIEVSPYCTVENNDTFFSYRKEKGKTGRALAAIGKLKG